MCWKDALVAGDGSTDNASFTISGNTLKTASVFDRDVKSSYSIRVRVTDSTNRTFERTFTINVTDVNGAPTAVNLSANTIAENSAAGSTIGNLSTTDPNSGDTFIYTLVSGDGSTDNGAFTISGNQLKLTASPNFETKSSYTVRIRSTDGGGLFKEQTFTITVTNVNEAPTDLALAGTNVPEGMPVGTVVGTFTGTDADASDVLTYSLVTGDGSTGNTSFTITNNQLKTNAILDRDTQQSYSIRVRVTDAAGLSFEKVFTINVTAENNAPTAIQLDDSTIDENSAVGTVVGNLTTTDPNSGDTFVYTLVAGTGDTGNASFTIVNNQLKTAANLNFEGQSTYSVRIRTTDQFNASFEQVFTITVNNVNEAPTAVQLNDNTVEENSAIDTVIGQLTATDPDAGSSHTFELIAGDGSTDNALFNISGNQLRTSSALNFEAKATYSIRVRVTDQNSQAFEQVLTINATDVNEQPTSLDISADTIAEGQPVGTVVGDLETVDPDAGDTFTYTLVDGDGDDDNASFTISGAQLKSASVFDQSTKSSYTVRVRTTDQDGLFTEDVITIVVTEVNTAPTAIEIDNDDIDENSADDTEVGTFTTTDENSTDTHLYSLVTGTGDTDNGAFTIVGDTLRTNANLDFETKSTYSIRVRSTDSFGLSFDKVFTITVNNLNEVPTDLALSSSSLAEDAAVGAVVGTLSSTDPDASNTHTYTLVDGTGDTDNAAFQIVNNELKLNSAVNFESQSTYSIRVKTQDAGGLSFEKVLTINITDVNEQPTALALSEESVAENLPAGTVVGDLSSTDPDTGDTHEYELVSGTGDTDNASFTIVDSELRTAASFNFETKASYSIRVRTTDADGLSFEQTFTIDVNDVNEAPTAIQLSSDTVAEDATIGTVIGLLTATDPDASNTHTFALVSGTGDTGNATFTIVGNELRLAAAVDFETQDTYSIRVRATDQNNQTFEFVFEISVTDVAE